jgi:hypothetical protein
MLSVEMKPTMLNVVMLYVVKLCVIIPSVVILSAIMMSVIMVNVAVPLFVFGILKLCLHWRNFMSKNANSSVRNYTYLGSLGSVTLNIIVSIFVTRVKEPR